MGEIIDIEEQMENERVFRLYDKYWKPTEYGDVHIKIDANKLRNKAVIMLGRWLEKNNLCEDYMQEVWAYYNDISFLLSDLAIVQIIEEEEILELETMEQRFVKESLNLMEICYLTEDYIEDWLLGHRL